jgi:hypothetical protein
MRVETLEAGRTSQVSIGSIGGDLRVIGRQGSKVEAQAPGSGDLRLEEHGGVIQVECRSNCLIFLPPESQIEIASVGGNMRAMALSGGLQVDAVGGDLNVRRIGEARFNLVGGDVLARQIKGNMHITRCGGDVVADGITGALRLESAGGDVVIRGVEGDVEALAGGDAVASLIAPPGSRSRVTAGGDLVCRLGRQPSVSVALEVGGELALDVPSEPVVGSEGMIVQLGSAEATLELIAGGDLALQAGEDFQRGRIGGPFFGMEADLADMEASLSGLEGSFSGLDAGRIGREVRRAVSRAVRKSTHRRHSHRPLRGWVGAEPPAGESVTQEERMAILRMLEAGKITTEEAEKLLQALEGDA